MAGLPLGLPAPTLISDFSHPYAYSYSKIWSPLRLFHTLRLFRTQEYKYLGAGLRYQAETLYGNHLDLWLLTEMTGAAGGLTS